MGHILIFDRPNMPPSRMPRIKTPSWDFLVGISGRKGSDLRLIWRGRDRQGTPVDFYLNEGAWWQVLPDNVNAREALDRFTRKTYPYKLRGTAVVVVGLIDMEDR